MLINDEMIARYKRELEGKMLRPDEELQAMISFFMHTSEEMSKLSLSNLKMKLLFGYDPESLMRSNAFIMFCIGYQAAKEVYMCLSENR